MADTIQVIIQGKDGVSRVFEAVERSAGDMQKSVSEDAKATGQSLSQMSKEAEKATSAATMSFDELQRSADRNFKIAGAAFGLAIRGFSNDLVQNEQQLRNLDRFYGEAASGLREYAQEIQNTTAYSSEQAVAVANIFGILQRNYGLQDAQIKQLIQLSADYAASSGMGIEDVAMRLQSAIRGEGEAAEALGLTMNQQSIDRQNLTLTMTNQEAAQYRYTALLQQSAVVEGAAAERAQTTAGKIAQLNNEFQDGARAILSYAGPLPGLVTGITSIGVSSGASLAGIVSLTKGLRDGAEAAGGYKNLISGVASSGVGTAAAIGGLTIAATAAFYGAQALARHFDSDFPAALHKAEQTAVDLDTAIAQLTGTLASAAIALQFTSIDSGLDQAGRDLERIKFLREQINTIPQGGRANDDTIKAYEVELAALEARYGDTTQASRDLEAAQADLAAILMHNSAGADAARKQALDLSTKYNLGRISLADYRAGLEEIIASYGSLDQQALTTTAANQKLASSFTDVTTAIAGVVASDAPKSLSDTALALQSTTVQVLDSIASFTTLQDAYWGLSGGTKAYAELQKDVTNVLAHGNEEQLQQLAMLEAMHRNRMISADTFATEVDALNNSIQESAAANALAEASQQRLNAAMSAGEAGARKQAGSVSELSETTVRGSAVLITFRDIVDSNAETAERAAGAYAHMAEEISHIGKFAEIDLGNIETVERAYGAWRGETEAVVVAHDKLSDSLAGGTDELAAYQQQLEDTAKSIGLMTNAQQLAAGGIATPSLDVAVNLQMGQGGFDAVMGAINTAKSLSSSIGGAKSWADELIGDPGTWSELDKLLAEGRIDQQQYAAAQEAQVSISRDVTNAQRDLLAVQANLAPTLADATRAQAEYIDSLQDQDAQSQLAALGYLDQGEAAKAMSLAQLVASSSTKEMKESTALMVQQAADADPVLKAMLQDMQLLDENGNVKFDTNAEDMTKAIDKLSGAVKDLTDVIAQLPGIETSSNAKDTQLDVDNLSDSLRAVPSDVSTNITANDYASSVVEDVRNSLNSIAGMTVAVNIQAVSPGTVTVAPGASVNFGGGRHGGILGYAHGGMVRAMLAEAGPELLGFANGGVALVPEPGVYSVPVGTSVTTAPVTQRVLADAAELSRGGIDLRGSTINLYPSSADIERELRAKLVAGSRSR